MLKRSFRNSHVGFEDCDSRHDYRWTSKPHKRSYLRFDAALPKRTLRLIRVQQLIANAATTWRTEGRLCFAWLARG
ncbi:unnamed protein product [Cylicocyclus nassatus]|uniref:Uncharacterized protein n=1 Tax=Cylicocyclus nassatus TaxID=53992 RepID=A0AA36HBP5_CYLNA|nr:unnamed protein product [Cylicocyclus nassatus]